MPRSKAIKVAAIALVISIAVLASLWMLILRPPSALQQQAFKPNAVLFDNVRVLSMAHDSQALPAPATPSELQAVLVIGNQIAEIGVAGSVPAPRGTLLVDGRGQTLMPGLIDAHVHLNDETELAAYLAHGVTGLRNMSGYPFHLRLIERIAQQQLIAPDLITTGPIINSSGPNELVLQTTVTTADEARAVVRKQHRAGYRANLILVPSDPLNDISVLEFPAGVMINGVWLDQHALDELKASARGSNTITFLRSLIRVIEMKLFT